MIEVRPLTPHIGADVEGVDLAAPLSHAAFDQLEAAWHRHLVLRFRNQRLDDEALKRFSERFGPLEMRPMGRITDAERARAANPYVTLISNIVENGRPIGGLGAGESVWHTDMSYIDSPPTASVLYAVEVPASGGDTSFASMYQALAALPEPVRARIATLSLKHDATHDSVGDIRRGFDDDRDPRTVPGACHPLIRRHPATGRDALYLGRRQLAYVTGESLGSSEALLDDLWRCAALPENCFTQQWRVGDVVMWDNRCTMHRRDAFDASTRRLMRRTQVQPIAA